MDYIINIVTKGGRPHKHKNHEIIVYIKGTGTLYVDGDRINITPGKMVVIPPGTTHYSVNDEDYFERIYISGDFEHIFKSTSVLEVIDNTKKEGLSLAKIIYDNRFANREYKTALINAFAHFLLSSIKIESDIFTSIKTIVDEITDNFNKYDIDLCSILNNSGYSEDYVRAQFKKVTGNTPTEFLTKTRISHACYLIDMYKNSISLNEISEKCGYNDYVYFSRKFKQIMGVSPREYLQDNI